MIRLLGSRPYDSITMVDIAAEADVAVRTVQRHYRTKDELLAAASAFRRERWQPKLSGKPAGLNPPGMRSGSLCEAHVRLLRAPTARAWAVYSRAAGGAECGTALHDAIDGRESSLTDALIGPLAGCLVCRRVATAARTLVALTGYRTWRGYHGARRFSTGGGRCRGGGILCQRLLRIVTEAFASLREAISIRARRGMQVARGRPDRAR